MTNYTAVVSGVDGTRTSDEVVMWQASTLTPVIFDFIQADATPYIFEAGDTITGTFVDKDTLEEYAISGTITPTVGGNTASWSRSLADVGTPAAYRLYMRVARASSFDYVEPSDLTILEVPGVGIVPPAPLVGVSIAEAAWVAGAFAAVPDPYDLLTVAFIAGKADKAIPATAGNVAGLTATGDLIDLGFRASWNADDATVDVPLTDFVTGQMFHELFVDARNRSGADIANGKPVMFKAPVGTSGKIEFQLAIADGSLPSAYIRGVTTEPIPNGEFGKVTWFGKVRGIDTTGATYGQVWADGDLVYVGLTAGALTNVEPNAPFQRILIGEVVVAHATVGTLQVHPTFNPKLTELDDVNGTPLTTSGQILVWDNINEYFDFTSNISDFDPAGSASTVQSNLTAHEGDLLNPHAVTLAQVGGTTDHTALSNIGTNTHVQIDAHISNIANPHAVTYTQAGADIAGAAATAQAFSIQRVNHTGTQLAATISDFEAKVRGAVLTGISFASSATITATDIVLTAFGKLQAQITAHVAATGTAVHGLGTASLSATTDFAPALGANDNYVTDAEKVVIGNTSGTNTGDSASDPAGSAAAVAGNLTTHIGLNGIAVHGLGTASIADSVDFDPAGGAAAAQSFSIQRANHTGTQLAATISDFAATVRATVLTGISFVTSTTITATDTVLTAFGKLQAQITGHVAATGTAVHGLGTASLSATTDFDAAGSAATAQAFAIQRANHTGTQLLSTISDAGTMAAETATDYYPKTDFSSATGAASLPLKTSAAGGLSIVELLELSGVATFTETATGTDRLAVGVKSGTPRILFEDGSIVWQVDNSAGTFRWFTPGFVHMQLTTTLATINLPLIVQGVRITTIKSGATQAAAGAIANELWKTSGHATLPDNVVLHGV